MTKDKMTVKELAGELRILPKELQQTLQSLNIEAKNASSQLTMDKVEQVRSHYSQPKKSDVIVRRKKQAPVETQTVTDKEKKNTAAESASAKDDSSVKTQEITAAANEQVSESTATESVLSVEEKIPADQLAVAETEKKLLPKKESPATIIKEAPVESRIISRPDTVVAGDTQKSTEQPENAHLTEESSEHKNETADSVGVKPEAKADTSPNVESSEESHAVQKQTETDAKPMNTEGSSSTEVASSKGKGARSTAPDASAIPEGSSAPTLPKRSQNAQSGNDAQAGADGTTDGKKRRERNRKKRSEPEQVHTPVRIISRPAPEAVTERKAATTPRPHGAGAYQGRPGQGQQGQHGRPGQNDRPGMRPRQGQGQGQGQGQAFGHEDKDAANRPQRAARPGVARPAGARAPGSDMNFGAGLLGEQSKKKRNKGRRTVEFQVGDGDFGRYGQDDENTKRMGTRHKARRKGKDVRLAPSTTQPIKAAKRKIRVTEAIRVADMAHQMGLKSTEIIKVLFSLGIMATINQSLDFDTATLVAAEFEYEVEKVGFSEDDYLIPTESDAPENLKLRPPVVTIMGHVDHGKTSLLDAIRESNVTGGEAGGITQHIGAYHVSTKRGEIVFLDTPGHELFTEMRARGAQVTDIVILVVAADDGVMEQTREAINHSKAAGVPIMVAVNKIDKEGADPDRVLRELAELGLQAEDWGGDTVTAKVSAKSRQGLDDLLELVALQAEILELKANPDKPARGHIVEAKLDKGRGPVATVLIQEGTLRQGDTFVCGVFSGRVRALFNDQGKKVKEAGPSMPVEVQGFDGVAKNGEEFVCVGDERLARRIAESRAMKQRERTLAKESKVTLETFLQRRSSDQEALTLNLVLKADVQGSLEAITEGLNKLSTEKVRINVVHGGAGAISESDILLASASQAIIIGFNIRPTAKIKEVAEHENVDIRYYDIVYKLSDDIKSAMQGMLAPVQREQYLGQAEVRKAISVPKIGVIAGCYVSDGKMARNAPVRLLRDGVVVYTGKISSLKRMKDDAREVLKGLECGICLENYNDIKEQDIIEAFEIIEEAATL